MKSHIILEPSTGLLYLLNEQGLLQQFDLTQGLQIGQQNGQLNISALPPFSPGDLVRSVSLDPALAHFNLSFDPQVQLLSIVVTPLLASSSSATAGGGKMKLGSVDLTIGRNSLVASTANLGAKEETGAVPTENAESRLEWYLLDLNRFNLLVEMADGKVILSALPAATGEIG